MKMTAKSASLAILFAAMLSLLLSPDVFAESATKSKPIIVKEKSTVTDTVSGDRAPDARDGLEPASKPFEKSGEKRPAGTAVMGEARDCGPEVIHYASTVVRETPNELVLNVTITKMEDDATLSRLASKIYKEKNGTRFENVTILWHLGANPEPAAPFARTDVQKNTTVFKIIKIEKK